VSRGLTKAAIKFAPSGLRRFEIADLNGAPAAITWTDEGIDSVTTLDIVDGKIVAVRSLRNLAKLRHLEASAVPH
jgi:hypothetical protein